MGDPHVAVGRAAQEPTMSKKSKMRKLKARRNKANHGKRPLAGRR